jgi:hypothetical protein
MVQLLELWESLQNILGNYEGLGMDLTHTRMMKMVYRRVRDVQESRIHSHVHVWLSLGRVMKNPKFSVR